ncbi:MAG: hypothetical protein ACM3U2_17450 [Deltaproteobacteria bacterium]
MSILVYAVDRPELEPLRMPDRFRHEITYFMTVSGEGGVPKLPAGEYWIKLADAKTALEEGIVRIVSPLDSASRAEIELSEEQEAWLEWMVKNGVEHVRLA